MAERRDAADTGGALHYIARADALPARLVVEIPEAPPPAPPRRVLLLKFARGGMPAFAAIDARCYHAGGLLERGGVAVYDGRVCISCPIHEYAAAQA